MYMYNTWGSLDAKLLVVKRTAFEAGDIPNQLSYPVGSFPEQSIVRITRRALRRAPSRSINVEDDTIIC